MNFSPSKPILAVKTLEAIEVALEEDQGARYRKYLQELLPLSPDIYRAGQPTELRAKLGASIMGKECSRELWYNFRWAVNVRHKGRMIRLFNRGHIEEPRFIALLKIINCEVWQLDENKKQYTIIDHDGHFGGSLDCVTRGIPDDPIRPLLSEFKTHNEKSFSKLQDQGLRRSKLQHFVQMQLYMGGYKLERGIYIATNKNDDDLYAELINFDREQHDYYLKRASVIITQSTPPPKISDSPGWFTCKFCDYRFICHLDAQPLRSCRSCKYSKPSTNGDWFCNFHKMNLTEQGQLVGCDKYERGF